MNFKHKRIQHFVQFYQKFKLIYLSKKVSFSKIPLYVLVNLLKRSYKYVPYTKFVSVSYEESTPFSLRKTHGTRTLSVQLSWFDNVFQCTEVVESNVLQYIVKPIWSYRESTGDVQEVSTAILFFQKNKSCAEWCCKRFLKKNENQGKNVEKTIFLTAPPFCFFEKTKVVLSCARFVLNCAAKYFEKNGNWGHNFEKTIFLLAPPFCFLEKIKVVLNCVRRAQYKISLTNISQTHPFQNKCIFVDFEICSNI